MFNHRDWKPKDLSSIISKASNVIITILCCLRTKLQRLDFSLGSVPHSQSHCTGIAFLLLIYLFFSFSTTKMLTEWSLRFLPTLNIKEAVFLHQVEQEGVGVGQILLLTKTSSGLFNSKTEGAKHTFLEPYWGTKVSEAEVWTFLFES